VVARSGAVSPSPEMDTCTPAGAPASQAGPTPRAPNTRPERENLDPRLKARKARV